jgi:outer membrane protein assembly factor BamB
MAMRWSIEILAPAAAAVICAGVVTAWALSGPAGPAAPRIPVERESASAGPADGASADEKPTLTQGPGAPGEPRGDWPEFRGPERSGYIDPALPLARDWPEGGPAVRWTTPAGEGYAGAAVRDGRVYLIDYDAEAGADALRCLSLDDGREIWRLSYPVRVKRSHGMSRTVPALAEGTVVSIGPKCHVIAADAVTGQLRWRIDMVGRYGTTVPPWYAGQCPLIDQGRVILAPAGKQVLLTAVDLETGKPVWTAPNTPGWSMTHASIARMEVGGRAMYVYCGSGGVAGVDAQTGELLWTTDAWQVRIATVPTPVVIGDGRLLLSGGYNAGCLMLEVLDTAEGFETRVLWRQPADVFGATQQTPILHEGHLFGVRPDGQFVCLDLEGQVQWASGPQARFGLGPFLIAADLIYLMDDEGRLSLAEFSTDAYRPLDAAQVLEGHESWGPMALAGDRLIVRDLTTVRCLDVGGRGGESPP